MKSFAAFTGVALQLLVSVNAHNPPPASYCYLACQTALSGQNFAGTPNVTSPDYDYYYEECQNELHVRSVYACAKKYCSPDELIIGYESSNEDCVEYGGGPQLSLDIADSITQEEIAAMPRLLYGEYPEVINVTTIPDDDNFTLGFRTIRAWYTTWTWHMTFCTATFIFWGIVLGFGVINNIFVHVTTRMAKNMDVEAVAPKRPTGVLSRLWTTTRAWIVTPATFSYHCHVPVWGGVGTMPPRIETIVITIYVVLQLIFCAVNIHAFERNLYFSKESMQIWRYVADRTGYLSYANLAIMWFFAIRNNILLWMTGWSFATFNRFHRWVARMATLQAIIHSIGYTAYDFIYGGFAAYAADWAYEYWYTGQIATIAMSLLLGFSIWYLRAKSYEIFLLIHIGLAVVVIVNLFYHTKIFLGEFDGFLWPCVAFWAFDRAVRIGRVLFYWISGSSGKAMVDYHAESDIVRVDVTDIVARSGAPAGSHFYIYTPTMLFGWESHPFTLMRWEQAEPSLPESPMDESPSSPTKSFGKSVTTVNREVGVQGGTRYSVLIRPYKGFTARLKKAAISGPKPVRMLLEGPYGESPALAGFDEVLLIIGGSGVSVAVSCIYDTLASNPHTKIRLVWAMRHANLLDDVLSKELKAASNNPRVTIEAFVTRDNAKGELANDDSNPVLAEKRPSVPQIIADATAACPGRLAVVVCGPAPMTDDTRAAVVNELKQGHGHVELFVEYFNW